MEDSFYLLFPMALIGFWLLALTGAACLIRCRGKNRRYLARTIVSWSGGRAFCPRTTAITPITAPWSGAQSGY